MSQGNIVQCIGAVVDIQFPRDAMPKVYDALLLDKAEESSMCEAALTFEVQQQLGDGVVRTIAMGSSDGLRRGMKVNNTGKGIAVPVGEATLGRIMDVLGRPIDEAGPIGTEERREIHQKAPKFDELSPSVDLLETGIKVIDLVCPFAKGGKVGLFGGAGGNFEPPVVLDQPGFPTVEPATRENPTLATATEAALTVLGENQKGFFLMVEQGDIDWANHANDYRWMMGTMHDLHEAVKAAIAFVDQPGDHIDWNNTLLMVTSDHGNSYMRLNPDLPLAKGDLPASEEIVAWNQTPAPGVTPIVTYGTGSHTNELVSLYVKGAAADLFTAREGAWYPGTNLLDNTQIHEVMHEFAFAWEYAGWRPGMARAPFVSPVRAAR